MFSMNMKRGFTLIELLVVIAILAILAVTVVVVLNPAELLRQSRDATRLSDMSSINKAVGLYLADGLTWTTASHNCTVGTVSPMTGTCVTNILTNVTNTGWVDLAFSGMSIGSPLPRLPLDPTNDATYYYAFKRAANTTYELDAKMESVKYATTTATQVVTKDGGNNATWYEVGSDLAL